MVVAPDRTGQRNEGGVRRTGGGEIDARTLVRRRGKNRTKPALR